MVRPVLTRLRDQMSKSWGENLPGLKSATPSLGLDGPRLYHYDVGEDGFKRRVHLRVGADKSAVVFVDVTDVIHLNPSAAEITWMALEGVSIDVARSRLFRRFHSADRQQVSNDLLNLYEMVNSLATQDVFCPNCLIEGVDQTPLFSTPADAPYKVDLALTYGCNNQCTHCYNDPGRYPMPSMSRAMWMIAIDRLHEIGVPHVIFTGGEATLHPDLPQLVRYAENRGMVAGLNTNGRRLAYKPYLVELEAAGLNHVQITLASNQAHLHDQVMGARAFEQTTRGIRNAVESGIHVITNTTLTSQNCQDVTSIVEFIYNLGIRTFAMNGMIHSGGGQSHPDAILPEMLSPILARVRDESRARDMRFLWYTPTEYCEFSPLDLEIGVKRCNAAEYSLCIEPNGDVLPCQSYYVSAGNILVDSWENIWNSDLFLSFRQRDQFPEAAGLPEKCWDCPEMSICGGGCRIERQNKDACMPYDNAIQPAVYLDSIRVSETSGRSLDHGYIPPAAAASTRTRGSGGTNGVTAGRNTCF
ncbi:MAG TPA: radical SAM protein [candidate division Zixibacteria bacterium]|nr:radical SAM protein [candidate division Zixibacteria bacterium]